GYLYRRIYRKYLTGLFATYTDEDKDSAYKKYCYSEDDDAGFTAVRLLECFRGVLQKNVWTENLVEKYSLENRFTTKELFENINILVRVYAGEDKMRALYRDLDGIQAMADAHILSLKEKMAEEKKGNAPGNVIAEIHQACPARWKTYIELMERSDDKARIPALIGSVLQDRRIGSLIELGCGGGAIISWLEKAFPESEICGVDYNSYIVDSAIKNHPKTKFFVRDVLHWDDLSAFENRFDAVVIGSTLHEILSFYGLDGAREFMEKAHAMLKKGGVLVIRDGISPDQGDAMVRVRFKTDFSARQFFRFVNDFEPWKVVYRKITDTEVEVRRKDFYEYLIKFIYDKPYSWEDEMKEAFGVLTFDGYRGLLEGLFEIVFEQRYHLSFLKDKWFESMEMVEGDFPDSHILLAARKTDADAGDGGTELRIGPSYWKMPNASGIVPLLRAVSRSGMTALEVSCEKFQLGSIDEESAALVRSISFEQGVLMTAHAPHVDIVADKGNVWKIEDTIVSASAINAHSITLHLTEPGSAFAGTAADLAGLAAQNKVVLNIENTHRLPKKENRPWHSAAEVNMTFEALFDLLSGREKQWVGMTLDLGHTKASPEKGPAAFLGALDTDIPVTEVHAHGSRFSNQLMEEKHFAVYRDHSMAGELESVLQELIIARDFTGAIILEYNSIPENLQTKAAVDAVLFKNTLMDIGVIDGDPAGIRGRENRDNGEQPGNFLSNVIYVFDAVIEGKSWVEIALDLGVTYPHVRLYFWWVAAFLIGPTMDAGAVQQYISDIKFRLTWGPAHEKVNEFINLYSLSKSESLPHINVEESRARVEKFISCANKLMPVNYKYISNKEIFEYLNHMFLWNEISNKNEIAGFFGISPAQFDHRFNVIFKRNTKWDSQNERYGRIKFSEFIIFFQALRKFYIALRGQPGLPMRKVNNVMYGGQYKHRSFKRVDGLFEILYAIAFENGEYSVPIMRKVLIEHYKRGGYLPKDVKARMPGVIQAFIPEAGKDRDGGGRESAVAGRFPEMRESFIGLEPHQRLTIQTKVPGFVHNSFVTLKDGGSAVRESLAEFPVKWGARVGLAVFLMIAMAYFHVSIPGMEYFTGVLQLMDNNIFTVILIFDIVGLVISVPTVIKHRQAFKSVLRTWSLMLHRRFWWSDLFIFPLEGKPVNIEDIVRYAANFIVPFISFWKIAPRFGVGLLFWQAVLLTIFINEMMTARNIISDKRYHIGTGRDSQILKEWLSLKKIHPQKLSRALFFEALAYGLFYLDMFTYLAVVQVYQYPVINWVVWYMPFAALAG
ncbi:MAG: methyltransferase, partial [Candidatus Omnitrophica bacterium]|nr:methyltransferase [Candidatus Omnitrophota bacterium]